MRAAGLKPSSDTYHQIAEHREEFEEFIARFNRQQQELFSLMGQIKKDIDWMTKNLCKKNGGQPHE